MRAAPGLDDQPGLVARAELLVGCGGDARAAVGVEVHEPLGRELSQCLADRRPRDAELLREILLVESRTALEIAAGDALTKHGVDLVGDALDLETGIVRWRWRHHDSGYRRMPGFVSIRMFRSNSTTPRIGYIMHMRETLNPVRIGTVLDPRVASFGAWRDIDVNLLWAGYVEGIEAARGRFPSLSRPPASSPTIQMPRSARSMHCS